MGGIVIFSTICAQPSYTTACIAINQEVKGKKHVKQINSIAKKQYLFINWLKVLHNIAFDYQKCKKKLNNIM